LSDALDADFSGTVAELTEVALREAIETAIHDLIIKGQADGIWAPIRIADHDPVPLPLPRGSSHTAATKSPARHEHHKKVASAKAVDRNQTRPFKVSSADSSGRKPASFDERFDEAANPEPASFDERFDEAANLERPPDAMP
jgi:hypothetical protein